MFISSLCLFSVFTLAKVSDEKTIVQTKKIYVYGGKKELVENKVSLVVNPYYYIDDHKIL